MVKNYWKIKYFRNVKELEAWQKRYKPTDYGGFESGS